MPIIFIIILLNLPFAPFTTILFLIVSFIVQLGDHLLFNPILWRIPLIIIILLTHIPLIIYPIEIIFSIFITTG
jgi:hypothetical protein